MKILRTEPLDSVLERTQGYPDGFVVEIRGRPIPLGLLRDVQAIVQHDRGTRDDAVASLAIRRLPPIGGDA